MFISHERKKYMVFYFFSYTHFHLCIISRIDQNMKNVAHVEENTTTAQVGVRVLSHSVQDYAVWFGGSMLAATAQFKKICCNKQQYEEEGARILRKNITFQADF